MTTAKSSLSMGCCKRQIAIHGDENVYSTRSSTKQIAVFDTRPAESRHRLNFVFGQLVGKPAVDALVEQHSHDIVSIKRSLAISRNEITCSRETLGKPSRKSSMDSPASR